MRNVVEEAFSAHLLCLKILGVLPFKNHENFFRVYSITLYILLTLLFPLTSIIWFATEDSIDVYLIADNAFLSIEATTFIFKYIPLVIYGPKIMSTISSLNNFNTNLKERQEIILNGCIKICRAGFWFFFLAISFALLFYSSVPALLKSGKTPIEIWTPFNHSNGTKFTATYCYVVIATCYGAIITAGYDILVAGLVYQAACQVQILKDKLQYLSEDTLAELKDYRFNTIDEEQTINDRILYEKIKECIIHHQNILSFVEKFRADFSFGVFAQFVGSCIVICLSVFEMTNIDPLSYSYIFVFIYTTNILIEIFLFCFFGTILHEESTTISTSIYMGSWYEFDLKSKKALIILMQRSSRPIVITVGTILDLSLDTFTTISRRAYSFYAVLTRYK